jgi:N-acyl homoserine lactone hydrolase
MSQQKQTAITPIHVGDLAGVDMPIHVHLIEHPKGRILVDTGLTQLHPLVADMDPQLHPLTEQDLDLGSIDFIVNTHLHFDHCGGNHLFPDAPIYVQRRELDDARRKPDYTITDWVDPVGMELNYVPIEGEKEIMEGVRLLPAPGHTDGSQIVLVETAQGPVVISGDAAVWSGELEEPSTEGQLLIRSLNPAQVWLAHATSPWQPRT